VQVLPTSPSVPAASAAGQVALALLVAALAAVLIHRRYRTRAA
jgi:MYXO-CTERM domain-containing protein